MVIPSFIVYPEPYGFIQIIVVMESKGKRNIVGVSHNGSRVNLDVDRIIAIDCIRRELYFEFVTWRIDDAREFDMVWNAWLGYDE